MTVMNRNWINWRKNPICYVLKKITDDVAPSGLRWKRTMHPVLASALIGLCSSVETRRVSTSDWWDASYAWPWLCFRHTVKHSITALDLVWLIRPPVFLGHLLLSFVTHSATSHPPNAIKEIKRRRTKMRANACPGFMGVMSQARGLSGARVGSWGSAGCALEMMTGVLTHFQHPRHNSPLFLGFETMKIITFWRQYTSQIISQRQWYKWINFK